MRVIAIEEHFATAMYPFRGTTTIADGKIRMGHDVGAELVDLGTSRVAAMDAAGIDVQVMSLTSPGCQAFAAAEALAIATDANDRLYDATRRHQGRLFGFAALPTADPAASVRELERAVTRLGFKGALINGHTQGAFLDDKKSWDIFACAQSLHVPIYLHPREPHPAAFKAYFEGYEELAHGAWGFALETCSHFLRLVFAGVFDAFPELTVILGHLGEGLPFWLKRLNDHSYLAAGRRGLKRAPADYLRQNLVVTCSGNFYAPALLCTVMALGIDNVLFSADWPFESNVEATTFLASLPLSVEDREKIAHRNAERVLRL